MVHCPENQIRTTFKRAVRRRGFTLIETMICVVILGLVGAAVFGVYASGLQTLDEQAHAELLESKARSAMEYLLSKKFAFLNSDSYNLTIQGQPYKIVWTVSNVDLDGDFWPDSSAKKVVVTLEDIQLVTIVVNHDGDLGKL